MPEYIEREAVLGMLKQECSPMVFAYLADLVNDIPAADVRPVVRAVWRMYSPFTDTYECTNCGEQVIDQQFRTNFCPNCGAMMEES